MPVLAGPHYQVLNQNNCSPAVDPIDFSTRRSAIENYIGVGHYTIEMDCSELQIKLNASDRQAETVGLLLAEKNLT